MSAFLCLFILLERGNAYGSVYSHKANDRFRKDKISILEQLGICISKEKEAEIYNKFSEEEIDSYAKMLIKENL